MGISSKVLHWSLVARKRDIPNAFFLLDFPPSTTDLFTEAVTMSSRQIINDAFAQRPDLRQKVLGAIGKLSPSIGPSC